MSTHEMADFVERMLMPLLVAFAVGFLVGDWGAERDAQAGAAAVHQARLAVARAHGSLLRWQYACEPLLALPPESAPEIVPDTEPQSGTVDERTPRPLPLRVLPLAQWAVVR